MGDFFKPWQRKVSVFTLMLACLIMVGWVRSILATDTLSWASGENRLEIVISEDHSLSWQTTYSAEPLTTAPMPTTFFPSWHTFFADGANQDDAADELAPQWRLAGFAVGEFPPEMTGDGSHARFCTLPYWSIVVPLILISAWLLRAKRQEHLVSVALPPIPRPSA